MKPRCDAPVTVARHLRHRYFYHFSPQELKTIAFEEQKKVSATRNVTPVETIDALLRVIIATGSLSTQANLKDVGNRSIMQRPRQKKRKSGELGRRLVKWESHAGSLTEPLEKAVLMRFLHGGLPKEFGLLESAEFKAALKGTRCFADVCPAKLDDKEKEAIRSGMSEILQTIVSKETEVNDALLRGTIDFLDKLYNCPLLQATLRYLSRVEPDFMSVPQLMASRAMCSFKGDVMRTIYVLTCYSLYSRTEVSKRATLFSTKKQRNLVSRLKSVMENVDMRTRGLNGVLKPNEKMKVDGESLSGLSFKLGRKAAPFGEKKVAELKLPADVLTLLGSTGVANLLGLQSGDVADQALSSAEIPVIKERLDSSDLHIEHVLAFIHGTELPGGAVPAIGDVLQKLPRREIVGLIGSASKSEDDSEGSLDSEARKIPRKNPEIVKDRSGVAVPHALVRAEKAEAKARRKADNVRSRVQKSVAASLEASKLPTASEAQRTTALATSRVLRSRKAVQALDAPTDSLMDDEGLVLAHPPQSSGGVGDGGSGSGTALFRAGDQTEKDPLPPLPHHPIFAKLNRYFADEGRSPQCSGAGSASRSSRGGSGEDAPDGNDESDVSYGLDDLPRIPRIGKKEGGDASSDPRVLAVETEGGSSKPENELSAVPSSDKGVGLERGSEDDGCRKSEKEELAPAPAIEEPGRPVELGKESNLDLLAASASAEGQAQRGTSGASCFGASVGLQSRTLVAESDGLHAAGREDSTAEAVMENPVSRQFIPPKVVSEIGDEVGDEVGSDDYCKVFDKVMERMFKYFPDLEVDEEFGEEEVVDSSTLRGDGGHSADYEEKQFKKMATHILYVELFDKAKTLPMTVELRSRFTKVLQFCMEKKEAAFFATRTPSDPSTWVSPLSRPFYHGNLGSYYAPVLGVGLVFRHYLECLFWADHVQGGDTREGHKCGWFEKVHRTKAERRSYCLAYFRFLRGMSEGGEVTGTDGGHLAAPTLELAKGGKELFEFDLQSNSKDRIIADASEVYYSMYLGGPDEPSTLDDQVRLALDVFPDLALECNYPWVQETSTLDAMGRRAALADGGCAFFRFCYLRRNCVVVKLHDLITHVRWETDLRPSGTQAPLNQDSFTKFGEMVYEDNVEITVLVRNEGNVGEWITPAKDVWDYDHELVRAIMQRAQARSSAECFELNTACAIIFAFAREISSGLSGQTVEVGADAGDGSMHGRLLINVLSAGIVEGCRSLERKRGSVKGRSTGQKEGFLLGLPLQVNSGDSLALGSALLLNCGDVVEADHACVVVPNGCRSELVSSVRFRGANFVAGTSASSQRSMHSKLQRLSFLPLVHTEEELGSFQCLPEVWRSGVLDNAIDNDLWHDVEADKSLIADVKRRRSSMNWSFGAAFLCPTIVWGLGWD